MTTDGDEGVAIVAQNEYDRRGLTHTEPTLPQVADETVDPWG